MYTPRDENASQFRGSLTDSQRQEKERQNKLKELQNEEKAKQELMDKLTKEKQEQEQKEKQRQERERKKKEKEREKEREQERKRLEKNKQSESAPIRVGYAHGGSRDTGMTKSSRSSRSDDDYQVKRICQCLFQIACQLIFVGSLFVYNDCCIYGV